MLNLALLPNVAPLSIMLFLVPTPSKRKAVLLVPTQSSTYDTGHLQLQTQKSASSPSRCPKLGSGSANGLDMPQ